ncbi:DUF4345 domain-containing protein [Flavobacterium sp.]|uniref:DUF4345 domain-containing protein n=1 Tax=Flavobacterium sp. TaxID=239 RepID=UPI00263341A7|nr:DUF4345 domain-containing protein [Flavobacterium sp.]
MTRSAIQQNLHLILSTAIVIPAALVYGLFPKTVLPQLFDFSVETTDLTNVFRAIMGLYLAFAFLWILGIVKPKYWTAATLSQTLFMLGLALGRIVSLVLDGVPSTLFCIGIFGELVLGIFGWYQFKRFNDGS